MIAFDVSPTMVRLTRERLGGSAKVYEADLSKPLAFVGDKAVDIVLCALVLSYVEDLNAVYREFNRVLCPGGHTVISVGHPWVEFNYTRNENYYETEMLNCEWIGFGQPYVDVPFYRKSLTAILRPLCHSGFNIEDILEPLPTDEGQAVDPATYDRLSRKPGFMCLRAVKTSDVG